MKQPTKPSTFAIALANAPTLLTWYKFFKAGTGQFIASDIGGQMLIAATHHAHTIFTWDFWHKLGQMIVGA